MAKSNRRTNQKLTTSEHQDNASGSTKRRRTAEVIPAETKRGETKKVVNAEDEAAAVYLTSELGESQLKRRLTDFFFHDADGNCQLVEVIKLDKIYISGTVLPLEENSKQEKKPGARCEGFGPIVSWKISGYEEGLPIIWISTAIAEYLCVNAANKYKKMHTLFFEKARACVEVYKKLSSCGGSLDLNVDQLVAAVTRSMSDSKSFPDGQYIQDFIVSQGEFIYGQLISLDMELKKTERSFEDLPVLLALRDESRVQFAGECASHGTPHSDLTIRDEEKFGNCISSACGLEEDKDMKMARLSIELDNWQSMNTKRGRGRPASSREYYIKINEDEIAEDYPLPAYYKSNIEEIDEYLILENVMEDENVMEGKNVLHNWSLYNSDFRLISLEVLPLKPFAEMDVTVYGSGIVTCNGENGFFFVGDSESSAAVKDVDGLPVFLSAIKEWKIEFGSSMMFISIRTDIAWYRLGRPSKQYEAWYRPVLKAARLGVSIISILKEESRAARLLFADIIQKLTKLAKDHDAFISSKPEDVERYVVVHGPILLQQLLEYPDNNIKKCPFVVSLQQKMELRHHTKCAVRKSKGAKKKNNQNPRPQMQAAVPKKEAMPATTTKLVNRVWGDYCSNYAPESLKEAEVNEEADSADEADENEDDFEDSEMEIIQVVEKSGYSHSAKKSKRSDYSVDDIKWVGETVGKTSAAEVVYRKASFQGNLIVAGSFVVVAAEELNDLPSIYLVEFVFETEEKLKMCHGRVVLRGSQTVLSNVAYETELFLTNDCLEFELADIIETLVVEIRDRPWGYEHRKANAMKDSLDRERAEERKKKGLPLEYYCRSLYCPQKGAFLCLPVDALGLGDGNCSSCLMKESRNKLEAFQLDPPKKGFAFNGSRYNIHDFVYVAPNYFTADCTEKETFKSSRNVGLKAFVVCQVLDIEVTTAPKEASAKSTRVRVRRYFRPEDISAEKAYRSDIREVYYSDEITLVPIIAIAGKCDVRRKQNMPVLRKPVILDHIFFCELLYDPISGATKQLPASVKLGSSKGMVVSDAAYQKKKGKSKLDETDCDARDKNNMLQENYLATLDVFAGCGGLSEGLQQTGITRTKWAIEYDEAAAQAFKQNHPQAFVFVNNCNVILRAIMSASGDEDDCISTPEASELAEKLPEIEVNNLPRQGDVEFINGGPPCQGFSGMNRFNQSTWSRVQCEMILSFLSFAEYYRPKYFLLENVRNFVSFNKGQTFRLTLASLLEMGYQVRFGILEAGAFGVSQSRKRAFIWAASPEETLPEWPEPMHVFAGPELKVKLSNNSYYAAVQSTANGAPFRSITVRDTIGDLPAVANGASLISMDYKDEPVSWFQRMIRGDAKELTEHISKEMNELNLIRCQRIPKQPGADWRDLPDEKVRLSSGAIEKLIPWCLPNTAKRHNQWKGLFGRLDWDGNFPTSVTDPQPMGKVGMCFHPDQDRIVTVRECARSQGFPDSYKFAGKIQHKHRQIGNAVPPPLAFALGQKLKEAMNKKLNWR